MTRALELALVVTTLIGATIALTTYAELRGCHWPLDVVNVVRDAATGAAQAQAPKPPPAPGPGRGHKAEKQSDMMSAGFSKAGPGRGKKAERETTKEETPGTECRVFSARAEGKLRAITRAPEAVQHAYREGRISETLGGAP